MKKVLEQMSTAHALCFVSADFFTTTFYLLFGNEVTHFLLKACGTLIIGMIGGLAGLLGKDLYPLLKKQIIRKKKNHLKTK
jgi:hypothetical protein